ncbi:anhydro-N-acetylmuramic acid kinase [Athalassotoga saccharophila]|uniref:anhydro-N-acetylmuramic acid kinase n=1 Tax=Athalassotoga saccharophila TaxID=1441386 RepID=UPI00137947BE|nr:anhydro-N-acetylmuramic acid kinase [Athalassotoga saccharophila]BBJ28799.1 anhydro-N-acetylmuramic acid kinase [Athalassotoga saccharophila]
MNEIDVLVETLKKPERKILGMMSGTSADGVDLVLTIVNGCGRSTKCSVERAEHFDYPDDLKREILDSMKVKALMRDVCVLDFKVGEFFGDCAKKFLGDEKIDLIASHGQTIFHNPPSRSSHPCTLQIGDGDIIAMRSGVITVSDFRIKDIEAGGEGAPLVPHVDYILYSRENESISLNNLGGISNLTYIPKGADEEDILAFDTGPANALIDLVVRRYFDQPYDKDGILSSKGKVNTSLLEFLKSKEKDYLLKKPPKSTGKEVYNEDYLPTLSLDPADILRTVVEFTSWSIYESYKMYVIPNGLDRVILTGGGCMNKTLVESLRRYFGKIPVEIAIDWQWREAKAFAILANELFCGKPANDPKVTGAKSKVLLGKISLP